MIICKDRDYIPVVFEIYLIQRTSLPVFYPALHIPDWNNSLTLSKELCVSLQEAVSNVISAGN